MADQGTGSATTMENAMNNINPINTPRTKTAATQAARARRRPSTLHTLGLALVAVLAALVTVAPSAQAAFGIKAFDGASTANEAGDAYTQAGGHPYEVSTDIAFNTTLEPSTGLVENPDADVKTVRIDLPPGLVGNPQAVPMCEMTEFMRTTLAANMCPPETQIGLSKIMSGISGAFSIVPLYNLKPGTADVPAVLGFTVASVPIVVEAKIRSGSDYGVTTTAHNVNQGLGINGTRVTVWGVPGDPAHDMMRCRSFSYSSGTAKCDPESSNSDLHPVSVSGPRVPFLSLPTVCSPAGVGLETRLTVDSWNAPGVFERASFISHLPPGFPADPSEWGGVQGTTGCERLPFAPVIAVSPTSRVAGGPTGLRVDLDVPQQGLETANGLASAHLRRASVLLPEGMSISPGAADGLQACSDAQAGFGSDADPACPAGSKIGSVTVDTPVLEHQLKGSVYVGDQRSDDPGSGEMFRLVMFVKAPGVAIKLRGAVVADSRTGQLRATFDNNPQLPFSNLHMELKDGPRAPLANPASCGQKTTVAQFTAWSSQTAESRSSFDIDCRPGLGTFDPSFSAGTLNPVAGARSPFVLRVDKPDGQSDLNGVSLAMPEGLLANLKGNLGRRIGTARTGAGTGPNPFWLSGPVVLEGPYGDAPFSLRVTVPAVAGPFNLGDVVVRQKIYVDPDTAAVRVVSDPLPTIVKGVPVRLQNLMVDIDRPGFMLNPTNCTQQTIDATLTATTGQTTTPSSRFQVGDCSSLAFKPRLKMSLAGRKQRRTGGHPALRTVLTQAKGEANIGKVKVTLPPSIALDANNSYDPKLVCDYDKALKADCPASSVIGKATAVTPVLNKSLAGNVHLVQGIKFGPKGNRIRTTPALLVKLRGEVAIDLRGKTTTEKGTNRLVTTFPAVPDAPISKFSLQINGGSKGILTVTRTRRAKINLCSASQVASVETDGQNGKHADYNTKVKTPCAAKASKAKAKARKAKQQQRKTSKR